MNVRYFGVLEQHVSFIGS